MWSIHGFYNKVLLFLIYKELTSQDCFPIWSPYWLTFLWTCIKYIYMFIYFAEKCLYPLCNVILLWIILKDIYYCVSYCNDVVCLQHSKIVTTTISFLFLAKLLMQLLLRAKPVAVAGCTITCLVQFQTVKQTVMLLIFHRHQPLTYLAHQLNSLKITMVTKSWLTSISVPSGIWAHSLIL